MLSNQPARKVPSHLLHRLQHDIAVACRSSSDSTEHQRRNFMMLILLARLEQGITQAQLAQRCGLTQSAIARVESGKACPSLDTLLKLAGGLNRRLVLE